MITGRADTQKVKSLLPQSITGETQKQEVSPPAHLTPGVDGGLQSLCSMSAGTRRGVLTSPSASLCRGVRIPAAGYWRQTQRLGDLRNNTTKPCVGRWMGHLQ